MDKFTIEEYEHILVILREAGYTFVTFPEFDAEKDFQILLRHDYDYELNWNLWNTNALHQIKSNHFFMVTGPYNLAESEAEIDFYNLKQNNLVGIHFDWKKIPNLSKFEPTIRESWAARYVSNVATLASAIFKTTQFWYSFHRPKEHGDYRLYNVGSPYDNFNAARWAGCTYDVPWYTEPNHGDRLGTIYLSDSGMRWKFGHPLEVLKQLQKADTVGRNMQILTHPIWWAKHKTYGGLLDVIANSTGRQRVARRKWMKDEMRL